MTLSIAIAGAAGHMGRALISAALQRGIRISGGTERAGSPVLGVDLATLAGHAAIGAVVTTDAAAIPADVWIDFTTPAATLAALAATPARAAIIGTTGLSESDEARIRAAAKVKAIVRSGNFSLGVNLLAALVEQAAAKLGPEWDIEIVEAHHRRKIDAPSGTALMLGDAAAAGRKVALKDKRLAPRDGVSGARPEGGIGFAVIRGGGIVGEHDVRFASEREVLTLSHQALDRSLFADGALAAAIWAADKPPGLYSMRDVLGL
ncbi:4-hydroxy-tetrahydrodipicolinate reductase [alpha proteobacterium U9-1i]|nr:4-hydroxy-tetrahydrodipicolinate reductase [alpha proteobacterium U9-1i]